jgi:hypothetical protein
MPTRRTPLRRPTKGPSPGRFPPEALDAFRKLQALPPCTCRPIDWEGEYWKRETCSACETRMDLHDLLADALRLPPWQRLDDPSEVCPYPPDHANHATWHDGRTFELYNQLMEATHGKA